MNKSWDLEDGLKLVRAIQTECRQFGYHLTLGGGVLNKGRSDKDLDLYFLPLENDSLPPAAPDKLVTWLTKLWGEPNTLGGDYENDEGPGNVGYKGNMGNIPEYWKLPDVVPIDNWAENSYKLVPMQMHSIPYKRSNYRFKLKFERVNSGDRIDVFIM